MIQHPSEIDKKKDINDFALNMAKAGNQKGKQVEQYQGQFIKRKPDSQQATEQDDQEEQKMETVADDGKAEDNAESEREKQIRIKKLNANRILHERNIYVFLASVAEDAINNSSLVYSDVVAFLLVKKLVQLVEYLYSKLQVKENIFQLELWEMFLHTKDYKDIFSYIKKEHEVFTLYFHSMYDRMQNNPKVKSLELSLPVRRSLDNDYSTSIDAILKQILKEYCKELVTFILQESKQKNPQLLRSLWIHADRVLDCYRLDDFFSFEDSGKNQFNFKLYYEEDNNLEIQQLIQKVEQKLQNLNSDEPLKGK